jgi:hypothetical protein
MKPLVKMNAISEPLLQELSVLFNMDIGDVQKKIPFLKHQKFKETNSFSTANRVGKSNGIIPLLPFLIMIFMDVILFMWITSSISQIGENAGDIKGLPRWW